VRGSQVGGVGAERPLGGRGAGVGRVEGPLRLRRAVLRLRAEGAAAGGGHHVRLGVLP
jgi:hypothetical protein